MLNSTEVLLGVVLCGGATEERGGVAKGKKERWEIRVRGKIRAIQRLSGRSERIQRLPLTEYQSPFLRGVAEADPWGGNENNKERKESEIR
jgi:hypothetical protein